ncbi:MAG: hypothetical protein K0R16_729 [Nitrososphaeraceae archaeon]|jgi:hypothetical protein|nr:hypothetical protein [Nitrososphaeraceae archaeon]MDF2767769.1 hypothetical protein [Nitrososphaeraceae archaeon]
MTLKLRQERQLIDNNTIMNKCAILLQSALLQDDDHYYEEDVLVCSMTIITKMKICFLNNHKEYLQSKLSFMNPFIHSFSLPTSFSYRDLIFIYEMLTIF